MKNGLTYFITLLCIITLVFCVTGCRSNITVGPLNTETPHSDTSEQQTPADTASATENTEMTLAVTEGESSEQTYQTEPITEPTKPTTDSTPPATTDPEPEKPKNPQTEPSTETVPPVQEMPEQTEPESTTLPEEQPAEVIDLDALVQYGLQYAANTHGYQISPGVRSGFYPAYTCVFDTMEEGRAAVRGCVDDTTNAMLAVPGTQIAVEIDGVMCRAKIDIVISEKGNGAYLVSVFYG